MDMDMDMDMDLQSSSNQYSNMDSATMAMIQQMQKLQPTTMQPHFPTPYPTASIEASSSSSSSPSSYSYCYSSSSFEGNKQASIEAMREMIFRIAAMQPVHIDPESVKPPKRRNVRISKDPQSVAARHRRERISERIRILQRLVPGGTKMDTASMLDEAIHYVKFLKDQVQSMEQAAVAGAPPPPPVFATAGVNYQCLADTYQQISEDHHSPLHHYSTR